MKEELLALEARNQGLQSLVGELLITNQLLREKIEVLKLSSEHKPASASELTGSATRPQPRPDR